MPRMVAWVAMASVLVTLPAAGQEDAASIRVALKQINGQVAAEAGREQLRAAHGRQVATHHPRRMGEVPGRQAGRTAALAGHAATTAGQAQAAGDANDRWRW